MIHDLISGFEMRTGFVVSDEIRLIRDVKSEEKNNVLNFLVQVTIDLS